MSHTWVSLDETDSLSSGNEGVKLAEIGVPGIPLAWTCSLSLPRVPSSSREFCVPSVTASVVSDSAGSPSPPDSLASEQRLAGSRQWPVWTFGQELRVPNYAVAIKPCAALRGKSMFHRWLCDFRLSRDKLRAGSSPCSSWPFRPVFNIELMVCI